MLSGLSNLENRDSGKEEQHSVCLFLFPFLLSCFPDKELFFSYSPGCHSRVTRFMVSGMAAKFRSSPLSVSIAFI